MREVIVAYPDGCSARVSMAHAQSVAQDYRRARLAEITWDGTRHGPNGGRYRDPRFNVPTVVLPASVWGAAVPAPDRRTRSVQSVASDLTPEHRARIVADALRIGVEASGRVHGLSRSAVQRVMKLAGVSRPPGRPRRPRQEVRQ